MDEREQLQQTIAALEAQRALLGDAVVEMAVGPLRQKLAALSAAPPAEQRKQVTVLFADVSGFTAMSEQMDPEEVSATMNALWARLDACITSRGGTIDKHIGDAVMALFGAPVAHEDDAEMAIRAALAMQSELQAFCEGSTTRQLQMRIGINTGLVRLGLVGTTGEYTAMGDAVNLASRLEHAAPVGGVLVSHDTYRHVRGVFDVLALDPILVKGKTEPIQVYVVRAAKPRAFRTSTRGVEGVETRMIGRETELRHMQRAMTTARQTTQTQLVSVVAEAGVGKSRLLYEFTNWLEIAPDRTLLFKGRATPDMEKLPYALVRSLFTYRFEIGETASAAVARARLEHGMAEVFGQDAAEKAHCIGQLLGFDFSHSPHLQGILADARQLRERAFHYIGQFFALLAGQSSVAMLLEDIHWADDASLDLVEDLLGNQPDLRLLIIGVTRPVLFERRPLWGAGAQHTRLDVVPLSDAQIRALIAEILRKAPVVPPSLVDLIASRVEGNPFYVEELIKMLIEDGVIVVAPDQWQIRPERLAAVRIPATLTGVLQARLDGLPQEERDLLQQAAVVGRVFWSNVLQRLRHPDVVRPAVPSEISGRLAALHSKELVFKRDTSTLVEMQEYIFKHAILHDVTYESVLKRLRRSYHAQVASCLEEISAGRLGEYAGRIGEHYERAEMGPEAALWYVRAGKQAQETYAPEAAITYYQKALALWRGGPAAQAEPQLEAYTGLGEMLVSQTRYAEAMDTYAAMLQAAQAHGSALGRGRAYYGFSTVQSVQGDHRAALESAAQAEAAVRDQDAPTDLALALWMKGRSLFRLGRADEALALGQQMLALTSANHRRPLVTRSLNLLGAIYIMQGAYNDAERCFVDALTICLELDDRRQMMDLLNSLGVIAEERGDYAAAFGRYQDALSLAREIGHEDGALVFLSNRGAARIRLGQYAAAEADLRQVIRQAEHAGSGGLADTYYFLAEACLLQSKLDDALVSAQRALLLGQAEGSQDFIAAAWRTLGSVAARAGQAIALLDEHGASGDYDAPACFAASIAVCEQAGMEGERARTLRAWATYELEYGARAQGEAMWNEARAIFARLGVALEVERMADLPVPGEQARQ